MGETVGDLLGVKLGVSLGETEGNTVGELLGVTLGEALLDTVGNPVGKSVGDSLGKLVGETVGGSVVAGQLSQDKGQCSAIIFSSHSCLHRDLVEVLPTQLQFFFLLLSYWIESSFLHPGQLLHDTGQFVENGTPFQTILQRLFADFPTQLQFFFFLFWYLKSGSSSQVPFVATTEQTLQLSGQ